MRVLKKTIWPHQIKLASNVQDNCDSRLIWLNEKLSKDRWYLIGPGFGSVMPETVIGLY